MAETQFKLQRAGDVALVTIDNGEDHTKPSTFGRAALESLAATLDELERGDFAALLLTGKPFVFAHRRGGGARLARRPRALRADCRAAVSDGRGDQRRVPRRRRRDRAPLYGAHGLDRGASLRLPRGLPRHLPRLGRHTARAPARRAEGGRHSRGREPDAPEPDDRRSEGARARVRRLLARAGRVPRRVARVRAGARGAWLRAQGAGLVGRGDGVPAGAQRRRGRCPRRCAGAVRRARSARGRARLGARRGLPPRGGGVRSAALRTPGAGLDLRVRRRRAPREEGRGTPRCRPVAGGKGRRRRGRADGDATRSAAAEATRRPARDPRPRPADRRACGRLDPEGARGALAATS